MKPEDVIKAFDWQVSVANHIGSVTIAKEDINAISALLREKDARINELELKIAGIMWFVDKWLDGSELEQDEVKRADAMREKTLRIVEEKDAEIKMYENTCGKLIVRDNGEVVGFIEGQEKTYINKNIARVLRSMAVDTARTNAITEFAERLKAQGCLPEYPWDEPFVLVRCIDQIANELKEEPYEQM